MGTAQHRASSDPSTTAWLAHSYDVSASGYDAAFSCFQTVKYQATILRPEIQSRLKGRVLDLGCGTGLLWEFVTGSLGWPVNSLVGWLGVDFSRQMLERANARGLRTLYADAANLPFPDSSFDLVLAFTSLGLLQGRIESEVTEALRVLHPDGLLVVTVLLKTRDSFSHTLHCCGARILQEISCGQDAGWIVAK